MQTEPEAETGPGPREVIEDAVDSAIQVTNESVESARKTANDAIPAAGEFLSRATYKTCYAIAFGVVYSTMLLVRAIPKDNAAVHGFIDGAHAAMGSLEAMKSRSEAVPTV